jgi:hypothetical protein
MYVVGPAMVWFRSQMHIKEGSLVLDTTKGPVHLIFEDPTNTAHDQGIYIDSSAGGIVVYKDRDGTSDKYDPSVGSQSGYPTGLTANYRARIDYRDTDPMNYRHFFANAADALDSGIADNTLTSSHWVNGRKVAMVILGQSTSYSARLKNSSSSQDFVVGAFTCGNLSSTSSVTNKYTASMTVTTSSTSAVDNFFQNAFDSSGGDGADFSPGITSGWGGGFNANYAEAASNDTGADSSNPKGPFKPTGSMPTAEHFWLVATGSSGEMIFDGNNDKKFYGMLIAPDRTVDYPGNKAYMHGFAIIGTVTNPNNSAIYIDGRVQAFPPETKKGTYHVKYIRRVN